MPIIPVDAVREVLADEVFQDPTRLNECLLKILGEEELINIGCQAIATTQFDPTRPQVTDFQQRLAFLFQSAFSLYQHDHWQDAQAMLRRAAADAATDARIDERKERLNELD